MYWSTGVQERFKPLVELEVPECHFLVNGTVEELALYVLIEEARGALMAQGISHKANGGRYGRCSATYSASGFDITRYL